MQQLYRPVLQPVWGRPARSGYPTIISSGRNSALVGGGASVSLQYATRVGDILFAEFASVQVGSPSVSGAGAVWTQLGRQTFGAGAQLDHALWMGRVIAPSTSGTVSISWSNNGHMSVCHTRGLQGVVRGAVGSGQAASGVLTVNAGGSIAGQGFLVASGGCRTPAIPVPTSSGHNFVQLGARATGSSFNLGESLNLARLTPNASQPISASINIGATEMLIAAIVT